MSVAESVLAVKLLRELGFINIIVIRTNYTIT